ncbi:MAG TPA: tRNA-dihydrouridine synthase family protein [Clostridia bacterium]
MNYYFAPMEGLTGYTYRNAHNAYFNNIDKYFSPFISANRSRSLRTKELKDILPENNQGLILVPQILTNNADDFICVSNKLKVIGYHEVNLNLGCPSGTVVAKGKGSGFLAKPSELDAFLYEIFCKLDMKISVKTRLGIDNPEEFYDLIKIFNKYPMEELIIHPRIQKDFYKNKPNLKIFKEALGLSTNPVCYNGDIFSIKDYEKFSSDFPEVGSVMIGRGLLSNPGLIKQIKTNIKIEKKLLQEFHNKMYEDYKRMLFGDVTILHRMKELWFYMISIFTDNEKYAKKIKKATKLHDYEEAVSRLFRERDIL